MTFQEFVGGAAARRRYWARSHLGWRTFGRALPNAGHRAVAAFARHGLVSGVITQNVDGLHQAAGQRGCGGAAREPGPGGVPVVRADQPAP